MTNNLLATISYLRHANNLVILRSAGSVWQDAFLKELCQGVDLVDLSSPVLRDLALRQPGELLGKYPDDAVWANIQYAPQLLTLMLEDGRHRLLLTTQGCGLLEGLQDAGKAVMLDLPLHGDVDAPFVPQLNSLERFSSTEYTGTWEKVFAGRLMKASALKKSGREPVFSRYLTKILQQDMIAMAGISDEQKLYRFLCAAAASVGQLVNYAMLAKAADISAPTAKQWLSLLEGAGVVYLLQPIDKPELKRTARASKLYFRDSGLAAYLLHLGSVAELTSSPFSQGLLECYVISCLVDSYLAQGLEAEFFCFRDSNAKEFSLLLQFDGTIYPVDIKQFAFPGRKLVKKLKSLQPLQDAGKLQVGNGCVIGVDIKGEVENGVLMVSAAAL